MKSPEVNCPTCTFFERDFRDKDGIHGFCRRFPPVLSVLQGKQKHEAEHDGGKWIGRYEHDFVFWVQPVVRDFDWCGEYKDKEQAK